MNRSSAYQQLFETSPDAILVLEGDRIVDCNPSAVRMLRFESREALLSRYSGGREPGSLTAHPADLSPPLQPDGRDSREKADEILARVFEQGSHVFEWTHLRADGESIDVEVQLTLVAKDPVPVLHATWRDVAERRREEERRQLAARMEAVGRLASGLVQDFNNQLIVIQSHVELFEEKFETGLVDLDHVEQIRRATDRAAGLTRQFLAFGRGTPLEREAVNLGHVVERLASMLDQLLGEHVAVHVDRADGLLTVEGDLGQLEQVVVHLATNARDAMPEGGRMDVRVRRRRLSSDDRVGELPAGTYVELVVVDTGSGMTTEQASRAFEPFFTTKEIGRGTGLGLATVRAIVERCDGHVDLRSELGRGTSVRVLLPLSDHAPRVLTDGRKAGRTRGGAGTVLLVEDDRAIRELFATALGTSGYDVHSAADGLAALELVEDGGLVPDLLVTDVLMPRLSGPRLADRLLDGLPDLLVVLMSGYAAEAEETGVPEDRLAVLQKPFSPSALLAEVRSLFERNGPRAASA